MVLIEVVYPPKNGVAVDLDVNLDYTTQLKKAQAACQVDRSTQELVFVEVATREYITEENWNASLVLSGKSLEIALRPDVAVAETIYQLQSPDPKDKKNAIFKLKKQLADEPFALHFISRGGVQILTNIILTSSGNLLSYALADLPLAMERSSWKHLTSDMFLKVVESLEDKNNNVIKNSLAIVTSYARAPPDGYDPADIIHDSFRDIQVTAGGRMFEALLKHISSTDLDVQLEALSAINAVISISNTTERREVFLSAVDEFRLSQTLRELIGHVELPAFREQAYEYQCHRLALKRVALKTSFDPESPYHEGLLLKYWQTVFPGQVLSDATQWRKLGFQTTDPSSEMRSTGLLGLLDAIAFAESGGDAARQILEAQASRPERDYPVTAAWLCVSSILVDSFKLHREHISGDIGDLFSCLFDSANSYFEIYAACVSCYDRMWDDLNCTYEDYAKATAIIRQQIAQVLNSNPDSLANLRRMCASKAAGLKKRIGSVEEAFASMNLSESEAHSVVALRAELCKQSLATVFDQRFQLMRGGGLFHFVRADGKNIKKSVLKIVLSSDNTTLIYGHVPDTGAATAAVAASIQLNDVIAVRSIRSIEFGAASPMMQALRKADEQMADVTFSLVFSEPAPNGDTSLDCICQNKREFILWAEGLTALMNVPFKAVLAEEDAATLADVALRARLAELDGGVEIPGGVPELPPRPAYAFKVASPAAVALAVSQNKKRGTS